MRRTLTRFFRRSWEDQSLLLHAFALHGAVRLACATWPFGRVVRLLGWLYPVSTSAGAETERVTWAVRTAARHSAYSTCLTEALTAYAMLRPHGRPASI